MYKLSKLVTLWGWIPKASNCSLSSHGEHPKHPGVRGSSATIASLSHSCSLESRAVWAKCQIAHLQLLFSFLQVRIKQEQCGRGNHFNHLSIWNLEIDSKIKTFPMITSSCLYHLTKSYFFSVSVWMLESKLMKSVILKMTKTFRLLRNVKRWETSIAWNV